MYGAVVQRYSWAQSPRRTDRTWTTTDAVQTPVSSTSSHSVSPDHAKTNQGPLLYAAQGCIMLVEASRPHKAVYCSLTAERWRPQDRLTDIGYCALILFW